MIISKSGALASIVKQGDYLVFKAEKLGLSVEYSPDASPENAVIGAFAARNGVVHYLNPAETAKLLQENPTNAEEMLVRGIEFGSQYGRVKNALDKMVDAIRVYADSGYATTSESPVWDGLLPNFHRAVVEPLTGLVFNEHVKRVYRRIPEILPGVKTVSTGKRTFITVDWKSVESPK
jgi:hypothetical protein